MIDPKVGMRVVVCDSGVAGLRGLVGQKGTVRLARAASFGDHLVSVEWDNSSTITRSGFDPNSEWINLIFNEVPDEETISPDAYPELLVGRLVRWTYGGNGNGSYGTVVRCNVDNIVVEWTKIDGAAGPTVMAYENWSNWAPPRFVLVKDVATAASTATPPPHVRVDDHDANKRALMAFFASTPSGHCACNTPRSVCKYHRDQVVA